MLTLLHKPGEPTAEEQRVASLLIQAMGAAQAPTPVRASQDGPNPAPEQAHSSVQRSASVAANSVPASFPQRIASLICIAACFTLAITLLDRVLGGGVPALATGALDAVLRPGGGFALAGEERLGADTLRQYDGIAEG